MSEIKCPFCGDEMKLTSLYMDGNHRYSHKYIGALSGGKDRCPFDGETLPLRALQAIHRTRKALDKGMEHITGLNNMIESWLNLIDGDLDQETKLRILKSAISAYVENKGGDND